MDFHRRFLSRRRMGDSGIAVEIQEVPNGRAVEPSQAFVASPVSGADFSHSLYGNCILDDKPSVKMKLFKSLCP